MVVVFIYITALFLVIMGLTVLIYPGILTYFYGSNHFCADWKNEFRAVYGGFGITTGALLFVSSYYDLFVKEGVQLCMGAALLGMALGRLLALLFERTGGWPLCFLVIEIVFGILLVDNATNLSGEILMHIAGR